MILSINQPAYLPWMGYFHRIAVSDMHIVLDHVQFEKNSFTNRNKVRTAGGWCWLTVPVRTKGRFGDLPISSLEIDNGAHWRAKHWRTMCQGYGKAPYFEEHKTFLESLYRREWKYLSDLCREITNYLLKALGITTPLRFSSEMNPKGAKDELVLNLCKEVGANVYLSGILGRDYIREELFDKSGIQVLYQDYRHPEYPQSSGRGFEPYMSVLDLLFNRGPRSLEIILNGQEPIRGADVSQRWL